jgi:hypothetical protein
MRGSIYRPRGRSAFGALLSIGAVALAIGAGAPAAAAKAAARAPAARSASHIAAPAHVSLPVAHAAGHKIA